MSTDGPVPAEPVGGGPVGGGPVGVVLLDPRRPDVLPVAALTLLRGSVQVSGSERVVAALARAGVAVRARADVLVSDDPADAEVQRRVALGHPVVAAAPVPGDRLLDAVAVMDRLRSPGGCPWDAEQTHASLRRYLVEECYELLDALEHGVRADVVEELGDVLLQVLFHARVAQESPEPFTVDDVADALVAKLVHRHPHVFARSGGAPAEVLTPATQELRWDELKAVEKRRASAVDGVAAAQPALALAAKLVGRAHKAGLPGELVPAALHGVDADAEDALRRSALAFAADVRAAERSARGAGLDPAALTGVEWHAHWPPP